MSPAQVSSVPLDQFEGIEADLTESPEEQAWLHACPRVLEEVAVLPGEEHLFDYDAGLCSSGTAMQARQITAHGVNGGDRASDTVGQ